ncbi:MAG: FAD-binding and (Fe-S)-binding domain-containing protein [Bacteroidales bacterium]
MEKTINNTAFAGLDELLEGDVFTDEFHRLMYATDASAYRELPIAVVLPCNEEDIIKLVQFAVKNKMSLIPRAAGTSLAGQVVGNGIVVDISKYMTSVLELNTAEKWVRVQPGVVLDELNMYLKPHDLFFGPETSTANRCMIGGMVGNNACGAHSLIYGSTRDHTIAVKGVLSDGSVVEFGPVTSDEFQQKLSGKNLEAAIYRNIEKVLSDPANQDEIRREYPDKTIKRRNTGYAIDILLDQQPFSENGETFNLAKLVAGSEGTLMFITEIKLNLVPLPPSEKGLVTVHCNTLEDALQGNLIALKHDPAAIELMDDTILQCTKNNLTQKKNRFFIQGDPGAILIIEFARDNMEEIEILRDKIEQEMTGAGIGFHFPLITGSDINKVWALRKAGLGVLSNIEGDAKPVSVIEDTAIAPEKLPGYIQEFKEILAKNNLSCVYHAHIATGELHLRPVLNLKNPNDVKLFREIATDIAKLVKKYQGSLSGEHGDGRLRGEFIPLMVGEKNYQLLLDIKRTWDSNNIFNPGKITDTPPMDRFLRYEPGRTERVFDTVFDFTETKGILQLAEKCNGSGDCRKSPVIGGTMCPSYMATRDENATTRARANILREFLTNSPKKNPFDHEEIYDVMDLCLSCKACKSECPSGVDVAKLKAEFLQHYYDEHGIPLRTRLIAYITTFNKIGAMVPGIYNFFIQNKFFAGLLKKTIGFAVNRSIPSLYKVTLRKWARRHLEQLNSQLPFESRTVNIFVDEFTDYNDTHIGIKAVKLLNKLGYRVFLPKNDLCGRTFLSKGLLRTAKKIVNNNIKLLKDVVTEEAPLLGIEPSAILAFRDEYPDLAIPANKKAASELSKNALMIDEFLADQMDKGIIKKEMFTTESKFIKLHGHCQQKAVSSTNSTIKILSFPENYRVEEIPSGCCGMAGSFGYEKEHYDVSMKVGELVLFPSVREASAETIIAAPGTSCRHQIKDGTGREGKHPVEILYEALK